MKQFYQTNQYIRVHELRVITDDGQQLGVLTKEEALKKAQELEMDLVLVAPGAKPPVAKIINFAKFRYQQEKKEQTSKKKAQVQELKEFRLSPFMAENDLNVRLVRSRKFLENKDKVRFVVWFRGRQIAKKQFGYEVIQKAIDALKDVAEPESEPKLRGKNLEVTLKPMKATGNKSQETVNTKKETPTTS